MFTKFFCWFPVIINSFHHMFLFSISKNWCWKIRPTGFPATPNTFIPAKPLRSFLSVFTGSPHYSEDFEEEENGKELLEEVCIHTTNNPHLSMEVHYDHVTKCVELPSPVIYLWQIIACLHYVQGCSLEHDVKLVLLCLGGSWARRQSSWFTSSATFQQLSVFVNVG